MCGRINVSDHEGLRALLAMMGMQVWPVSPPRFNVPPTAALDTIVLPEGEQTLQLACMNWGFLARAAASKRRPLFNARSETVFAKPTFRSSARAQRAIVPINGYYEWLRDGQGNRQAFHISNANEPVLALAAIYQPTPHPVEPEVPRGANAQGNVIGQLSFDLDNPPPVNSDKHSDIIVAKKQQAPEHDVCVLTMPANKQTSGVHHRMPVILDAEQAQRWIVEGDESMLDAFTTDEKQPALQVKPVSDYVNNAANDGPDCLRARA